MRRRTLAIVILGGLAFDGLAFYAWREFAAAEAERERATQEAEWRDAGPLDDAEYFNPTAGDPGSGEAVEADPRQPPGGAAPPSTSRPLSPGLVQQRDLRRRVGEAAGLGARAGSGDAEAAAEVARRLVGEPDPRVRQALSTGAMPDLGRQLRWTPPVLPEPAKAAEPGEVRAYWLTPSHEGTYESTVQVDGRGRARVETVYESADGTRWQVRYDAWAFRDAQGRLVVDARGQPVEYLQRPQWGAWSPDSMVIGQDGLIDMVDDKHDPGQGTSGARGPG